MCLFVAESAQRDLAIIQYNNGLEGISEAEREKAQKLLEDLDCSSNPTYWIVSVGISQYQNLEGLSNVDVQARDFAYYYVDAKLTHKKIGPTILQNREAKKAKILDAIRMTFLRENNPYLKDNDVIVFFFSGHGKKAYQDGPIGDLLPWEFDIEDNNPSTWIKNLDILKIMDQSPVKNKVCIIEACKTDITTAGLPNIGMSPRDRSFIDDWFESLDQKENWVYLTSTLQDKVSLNHKIYGGLFSYCLLNGLKQGAADGFLGIGEDYKDGVVTIEELKAYVETNLKGLSNKINLKTQVPVLEGDPDRRFPMYFYN